MGIRRARVRMSAVGTGLVVAATVLGGLMPLPATSVSFEKSDMENSLFLSESVSELPGF